MAQLPAADTKEQLLELQREAGRAGGILGGRPPTRLVRRNEAFTKQTGAKARRTEPRAHEAVKLCDYMKSERSKCSSVAEYWKTVTHKTDYTRQQLEAVLQKEGFYKEFMASNQRGTGGSLRPKGGRTPLEEVKSKSQAMGCRRKGAGRKDQFRELKLQVKRVAEEERQLGHSLSKLDVWLEFRIAASHRIKELRKDASAAATAELQALETRMRKLQASQKYRDTFQTRLLVFCDLKLRKPQRVTRMTPAEERVAAEMGWRWTDRALWLVGCAGVEELRKHVLEPEELLAHKELVALVFSDQVPYWTGLELAKQVYLQSEFRRKNEAMNPLAFRGQEDQVSQRLQCFGEDPATEGAATGEAQGGAGEAAGGDEAAAGGAGAAAKGASDKQLRGSAGADSRIRITVQLRQAILHYFSSTKEPVGVRGRTILIFPGVRARLENISDDGKWLEDEVFEVCGASVVRKAGTSVGNIMVTWRKLRKEHPELLEGIRVWQQPSAVMDSVLQKWDLEDLKKDFPYAVWTRDCLGCALTERAMEACRAASYLANWVPAGMTPCMQLTDTDEAAPFKAACRRAKDDMRMLLREKAKVEGVQATYKLGFMEVLAVVKKGLEHLEELNRTNETILKGARRNGLLAWRPREGVMQRADAEAWAARMPEESHRLEDEWRADRYQWLDASGVPTLPELQDMDDAAWVAQQAELEYARDKLLDDADALVVDMEASAGFEGFDAALNNQKHPAERALNIALEDVCQQKETVTKRVEKHGTVVKRQTKRVLQLARRAVSAEVAKNADLALECGISAAEQRASLVPQVLSKEKKKKEQEAGDATARRRDMFCKRSATYRQKLQVPQT